MKKFILTLLLFLTIFVCKAQTNSVVLAWDPSNGTNVVGYNIYYGYTSRVYSVKVNTGNVTNTTVILPYWDTNYFFVATAYNVSGTESVFSNEIVYYATTNQFYYTTNAPSAVNNLRRRQQ